MEPATTPPGYEDGDTLYVAPPPYELRCTGELVNSAATITDTGRVNVSFSSPHPEQLANLLPETCKSTATAYEPSARETSSTVCPRLNVVILVVGSRGDVQPFIALGVALARYGHRVRLATHDKFADFVRASELEFYPIGGDPEDLMSYMVRNPGLIPSVESMRRGDVGQKRRMIKEMLKGCWEACICPDPVTREPFVANAVIANPPSFAHVHCAQALRIPVHIMFTMPWTATKAFPHPLANLKSNNMEPTVANWLSYGVFETMTWQGLGDIINVWRRKTLGLDVLQASMGPGITTFLKIPHTYCWSPTIMSKPADWGPEIEVCGFFLRDEPKYDCPRELDSFLHAGPPPVYVGFGSIVLDDPKRLHDIILEAAEQCGVRVIISRGWSKLGGESANTQQVFYLGDCPYEWLFKRVSVVVHHGGAGTTACGLVNACPTVIVPFFGDQPFWGEVVASTGAGASPIPYKELTANVLANAIRYCLEPETGSAAQQLAHRMNKENGVQVAVNAFHRNLPTEEMACDALPQYAATWQCRRKGKTLKLCDTAASVLLAEKKLKESDLKPLELRSYNTDVGRWDPFTGGASSVLGTLTDVTVSLGRTFINPFTEFKRHRQQVGTDGTAGSVNGAMGSASLAATKSLGKVSGAMTKGALLDLPLAMAEGMRNVPALYGAEVDDYGRVNDWKSGSVVGGKALGLGLYNGISGLATEPYKGFKKEGSVGLLKGIGKGSIGMIAKTGTATFGLFAYPAQSIYKSILSREDTRLRDGRLELLRRASTTAEKGRVMHWFLQVGGE